MIDINPEKRGDKAKPAISRCVRRLAPVFMRFSRNLMTKTNSDVSAPSQQARRIPLHSYAGEKRDSSRFALRMTCGVILVAVVRSFPPSQASISLPGKAMRRLKDTPSQRVLAGASLVFVDLCLCGDRLDPAGNDSFLKERSRRVIEDKGSARGTNPKRTHLVRRLEVGSAFALPLCGDRLNRLDNDSFFKERSRRVIENKGSARGTNPIRTHLLRRPEVRADFGLPLGSNPLGRRDAE